MMSHIYYLLALISKWKSRSGVDFKDRTPKLAHNHFPNHIGGVAEEEPQLFTSHWMEKISLLPIKFFL